MELVEFWRARRALLWYLGIVLAIVAFVMSVSGHATVQVNVDEAPVMAPRLIPLSALLAGAMFFTAMLASWLGLSLNRENATVELSWTRPTPRPVLAARFIGIDLAALAIAFVLTTLGSWLLVVSVAHVRVGIDEHAAAVAPLAAGVVTMWYALVLVLSAGIRGHGGAIGGLVWPVAIVLIVLAQSAHVGVFHDLAVGLNIFNPLAYVSSVMPSGGGRSGETSVWPVDIGLRTAAVWAFAAGYAVAAVAIWQRREA